MRRFLDKWGTAIAAVACALTIVFAAVYTRQDDLKRCRLRRRRRSGRALCPALQARAFAARTVMSMGCGACSLIRAIPPLMGRA